MGGPETVSRPPISNDQFLRQMFRIEKVGGIGSAGRRRSGEDSNRLKKSPRFRQGDFPGYGETVLEIGCYWFLHRDSEFEADPIVHDSPPARKNQLFATALLVVRESQNRTNVFVLQRDSSRVANRLDDSPLAGERLGS